MKRPAAYYRVRLLLAAGLRPLAPRLADRLSFTRSVYGPALLIVPGDRTFELCVHGYGRFVSDAVEGQAKPFVFLDVGANLGLFSLLAARNPNCRKVIAIEPLPTVFRWLQANIRHAAAGNIATLQGAIHAGGSEQVAMSFNPAHSGMSQVLGKGRTGILVPVIAPQTLDESLAGSGERIVAKIDVEGSEIDVIAVLRQLKSYDWVSDVIIEVSHRTLGENGRNALLRLLAEDGFTEQSRAGEPDHYDAWYRRS
jgi:FkbM family methyltransferase